MREWILPGVAILLMFVGMGYVIAPPSPMAKMYALVTMILGGILLLFAYVNFQARVQRSGLAPLIRDISPRDVLVLWVSATGKIFPVIGREMVYERYLSIPPIGRLRITKGSDYMLPTGRKCFIATAGVGHTIPAEQIKLVMEMRELGFKNFQDAEAFVKNFHTFLVWLNNIKSLPEEQRRQLEADIKQYAPVFVEQMKQEEKALEEVTEVESKETV
jgi:hypothetical protein